MPPTFEFDPKVQRYRYKSGTKSGRFISRQAIASLIESHIEQEQNRLGAIADLLLTKKIRVSEWEQSVAKELKLGHINAYLLGRGGKNATTPRDWGLLGQKLKVEYGYLRGFSQEILDGKLSEAQIKARLRLYQDAYHKSYELARLEGHIENGWKWERRRRNAKESCASCIGYEGRGWSAIGTLPNPGEGCECMSACRCHKEFSKDEKRPKDMLLKQSFGWLAS
ncbi:MAG: hypothetical protein KatS3mg087_0641 [Patescibacteria group bacterium]|nr:MAG: hypothetical protein KatS3mg087_0641 [Patescibacteria group bacterium]